MNDRPLGPGWWVASDGQWYPPEQHPDAGHRASHVGLPTAPSGGFAGPDTTVADVRSQTGESRPAVHYPHVPPVPAVALPPEQWPATSTRVEVDDDPDADVARILLGVAFLAALVVIVGSFLPWVRFGGAATGEASAWDRHSDLTSDGLLVTVAGVVAATICGALMSGARHLLLKLALLAAGVLAFVVFLVDAIDTRREDRAHETIDVSFGIGLWLVGVAALVLVVVALVERSPWRWKAPAA